MSRHRAPRLVPVTRRASGRAKRRTRRRRSTGSPQRTRTGPSWRRGNPRRPTSPTTVCIPLCSQCVARSRLLTFFFSFSRTRPTLDGGTDSGARNRGKFAPSSPRTLVNAVFIQTWTGTQVARGFAETKGQRRVPGPKVRQSGRTLHARHHGVGSARARVLQQSRRVLRQHGTATARKGRGGLRRGPEARLTVRQSTQ